MKITGAQVLEFRRRLDGRSWNPSFRWTERRAPLLLIETDAGAVGVGEAWSRQPEIERVLDDLADRCAPALLGQDPSSLSPVVAGLAAPGDWVGAASGSAIDMAAWDLVAQAKGEPLWRALGGSSGHVRVYASGGLYRDGATLDDLAREFAGYVGHGFTAMKMKIGGLALDADIARVRTVRDAIGDATLWVDAVNQLTARTAPQWCEALARFDVAAIQAPLAFDDVAGMAEINQSLMPVVATEAEHRESAFRALLDANAVAYLQYCVGVCGGFTGAARLDDAASRHRVPTTPQCFSTAVMQAASLHFTAARDNVAAAEYHRFHDHLAACLPSAMRTIESGAVELDDTPGLGVRMPALGEQPCGGEIVLHRHVTAHPRG
ncbi:MAG TPA: mandelate racemase/muconate lactonizing enzyme family protein [Casimicrobiaceae bacterium]|nr:mandelate racemase/muconate lactonizing enzyme family protein [Casimicrobiaceae bacterium]